MNEIEREKSVILVADDDESTRLVLRGFLENDGYTVFEATDGAQALSTGRHDAGDGWFYHMRPDTQSSRRRTGAGPNAYRFERPQVT